MLISGIAQGLMWVLLAIGVYVNFNIIKFPDMTTEGSLTFGAVISVICINSDVNPVVALLVAAILGMVPGIITGVMATYLRIQPMLAGILTMIAMYSINLRIMGDRATISISQKSLKDYVRIFTGNNQYNAIVIGMVIGLGTIIIMTWFFSTRLGFTIKATGSNSQMAISSAINTNKVFIISLALSNALIAVSGGLIAQFDYGAVIITMGQGSMVIGLASVMLGLNILFRKKQRFVYKLIAVGGGAIIYRCIVALALLIPFFKATDLKLLTAILVVSTLYISKFQNKVKI